MDPGRWSSDAGWVLGGGVVMLAGCWEVEEQEYWPDVDRWRRRVAGEVAVMQAGCWQLVEQ